MKNFFQKRWQAWKRIAQFIGDQIARVFLTLYYFTLFMPFGMGVRLWGDPLTMRPRGRPKWVERITRDLTVKDSRRLY